ncbi:MAG: zinc-finger domain-containing protein [Geminicoccaceae bacterium]
MASSSSALRYFMLADREVVIADQMHVSCDGGRGALGHPREFLTLADGGETTCKYCGRRYVHRNHKDAATIAAYGEPWDPNGPGWQAA